MAARIAKSIVRRYRKFRKKNIQKLYAALYKKRLRNDDFAIISNNCWGGDLYQILDKPFNSPFIGLFLNAPCFISFLKKPEYYLSLPLEFIETSKYPSLMTKENYPIGKLDDIEIHFLHYKTVEDAKDKWTRRSKRLPDKSRWLVKSDDRDNSTPDLINEFHSLPYKNAISFSKTKYPYSNNVQLQNEADMILLHTTHQLLDIIHWINTNQVVGLQGNMKYIQQALPFPNKFV